MGEWLSFHAAIVDGTAIGTDIADAREDLMLIEQIMKVLGE